MNISRERPAFERVCKRARRKLLPLDKSYKFFLGKRPLYLLGTSEGDRFGRGRAKETYLALGICPPLGGWPLGAEWVHEAVQALLVRKSTETEKPLGGDSIYVERLVLVDVDRSAKIARFRRSHRATTY